MVWNGMENGMERKFRYGIWEMPKWNGMEDFKNGMEDNLPYFYTGPARGGSGVTSYPGPGPGGPGLREPGRVEVVASSFGPNFFLPCPSSIPDFGQKIGPNVKTFFLLFT